MSYRAGSQPPSGYVAWHDWAEAQGKGGLEQTRRPCCQLWKFPQEKCGPECRASQTVAVRGEKITPAKPERK